MNLEEYFPPESFIRIDIAKPEKTVAEIKDILEHDRWESRLPALEEARNLILHKYQLFPSSDLADSCSCGSAEGKRADRHSRLPAKQQSKIFSCDVQAQENVFQDVLSIEHCRTILNVTTVSYENEHHHFFF